jgi:putative phage-type endonuclease
MENYLQGIKKIDINALSLKNNCKKSKMNKDTKLNIQNIIHDVIINGEIGVEELDNPIEDIIDTIFMIVMEVEKKKSISPEEVVEIKASIKSHLKKSVKIMDPIHNDKEIDRLTNLIIELKKIPQPEQRTPAWHEFRGNRLTASDLGTVMGMNPYEQYKNAILKKCGLDMPFVTNKAIQHGVKHEETVTKLYELRNSVSIYEYGCIPHPTIKHFGASPDGIVDIGSENKDYLGRMIEIKCPTGRPITGFCPEYYWAQVQGQLEVCDLKYCDFVECLIHEYGSAEEYFNDVGISDYYNSLGMEKGVIIDAYDLSKKKEIYYYGKFGMTKDEITKWETEIIDNIMADDTLEYQQTGYWKLIKYNALLIERDVKWWNDTAAPKINQYWEDVLEHRKKPMEELQKIYKPNGFKKKIKKEINTLDTFVNIKSIKKPDTGFLTDSDED